MKKEIEKRGFKHQTQRATCLWLLFLGPRRQVAKRQRRCRCRMVRFHLKREGKGKGSRIEVCGCLLFVWLIKKSRVLLGLLTSTQRAIYFITVRLGVRAIEHPVSSSLCFMFALFMLSSLLFYPTVNNQRTKSFNRTLHSPRVYCLLFTVYSLLFIVYWFLVSGKYLLTGYWLLVHVSCTGTQYSGEAVLFTYSYSVFRISVFLPVQVIIQYIGIGNRR